MLNSNTMVSVLSILVLIIQFMACQCLKCPRNEKWDRENKICDFCDHDTFMPEEEHNHTECYPCTQVRDVLTDDVIRECRHICAPYMVDNHHNITACNSCQQLIHNLTTACNITLNSTPVRDGQDGSTVDTASFNSSHLPDICKNCLGEKKMNKTDQKSAALTEGDIDEVFRKLQIIIAVLVGVILVALALIEYVAVFSKLYLTLMKYCIDKQCALRICMRICMYTGIALVVVCILVTMIVQTRNLALNIFLLLMQVVAELCIGAGIIIAILNMLQLKNISQKTTSGREHLLDNEKKLMPEHNDII